MYRILRFNIIHWNTDPKRTKVFPCQYSYVLCSIFIQCLMACVTASKKDIFVFSYCCQFVALFMETFERNTECLIC